MGRLEAAGLTVALALTASACGAPGRDEGAKHSVERARVAMGSELRLTAWTSDEPATVAAFDAVFAEFERLEALMSNWRANSDINRINAAAGMQPVKVAPEVREVLLIARQVSDWTGGRFDVTFGPLAELWKFDQDQDNTIPDPEEVRRRLPLVDYHMLDVDERAGTVFLRQKGMRAHLGGIGKGYAVDRASAILRRSGLRNFMIQAGGDLYVSGFKNDQPWRLGIRDPRGPANRSFAILDLANGTFSTSGDYERFFIKDGVRYHHILDLSRGEPARLCRSVTMVTDRAVIADALAKGVFILGPKEGMALVERLHGVESVIVGADNHVSISKGLRGRLQVLSQPTDAP